MAHPHVIATLNSSTLMSRKTAKQSTYLCALSVLINFLLTKYLFCILAKSNNH